MKVIILAAGYATRLYPLTLTQPKPLLPVAGKPMVEHVLDNLAPVPVLALSDVGDLEQIKKYNSISTNGDGRITFFEEKPKDPTSTLTGIGLYFYPKSTIPLIKQYIAEGNNPDQPGRLVQWLYPRTP